MSNDNFDCFKTHAPFCAWLRGQSDIFVLVASLRVVSSGPERTEYEKLASVEEYLILDSRRCWTRLHRRDRETRKFGEEDYALGDEVTLESIGLTINLEALYAEARIKIRRSRPRRR